MAGKSPPKSVQIFIHTLWCITKVYYIACMQQGGPVAAYCSLLLTAEYMHSHQKWTEQIRSDHNLEAIDKALIRPIRQIIKKAVRSVNFPTAYSEKQRPSGLAFPIWHHLRPAAQVSML